ncbi:MAG: hypothetical protein K6E75_03265 [Lachnospiraceae bacterium]|nr:hypothetical protein [Lachnospiraceae bacterium]
MDYVKDDFLIEPAARFTGGANLQAYAEKLAEVMTDSKDDEKEDQRNDGVS